MKLLFLIGDAAVGKMTVGQELMKQPKTSLAPADKRGFFGGGVGEIRTLARFLDAYSLSRGAPSASWVPLRI